MEGVTDRRELVASYQESVVTSMLAVRLIHRVDHTITQSYTSTSNVVA